MAGYFTLWAIKHNTTYYRGIQEQAHSANQNQITVGGDGTVYRSLTSILEIRPTVRFTTVEAGAALTNMGVDGTAIGANDIELHFAELDNEGTLKSTGVKVAISDGIIAPVSLNMAQGGTASLSCQIVMGGDGANSPVTFSLDQTLPTSDELTEFYTLGTATINSVALTGVQNVSIDFGVGIETDQGDGDVYPQIVAKTQHNPTLQLTTKDMEQINTHDFEGADHTISFVMQKLDNKGTVAGSGDKTFTTTSSHVYSTGQSASQGARGTTDLMIQTVWDGDNHPIAMA